MGNSAVFISHLERFACLYEGRAGSTASRWKNLDRGGIPPRGSPLHLSCVLARPRGHTGEADQSHPQCGRQVWLQSQAALRKAPRGSVDQVRVGVQAEGRSHMGYSPSGFRQVRLENAEPVDE